MRPFRPARLAALVLLVLPLLLDAVPARAGAESSIRCPGGIVAVGDLELDLLGKCGEPTLRETSRAEEVAAASREPGARAGAAGATTTRSTREASVVRRWTYDLGRNRFLRIVTLQGGRVRSVATGGRGFTEETEPVMPAIPIATCDSRGIGVGDEAYALQARCGAPATREVRLVERSIEVREGGLDVQRSVTVAVEVWAFHFGPHAFTRVVELEEGRVVRVETAGRGYAR